MQPIYGDSGNQYKPSPDHYPAVAEISKGHIDEPGTVDLSRRQIIDNTNPKHPDPRDYGSEYSARDTLKDGRQMTYPLIYNGAVHDRKEAFDYAQKTQQHMGIYKKDTPEAKMTEIENALHSRLQTVNGQKLDGEVWKSLKEKQQAGTTDKTQNMFRNRSQWKVPTNDHVEGTVK